MVRHGSYCQRMATVPNFRAVRNPRQGKWSVVTDAPDGRLLGIIRPELGDGMNVRPKEWQTFRFKFTAAAVALSLQALAESEEMEGGGFE